MGRRQTSYCVAQCLGTLLLTVGVAHAQELEPRSYSPAPIGTTFVLGGFGSEGESSITLMRHVQYTGIPRSVRGGL